MSLMCQVCPKGSGVFFKRARSDVCFKPPSTLRSLLCRKKPSSIEKLGLVYRIACSDCSWSYVGETGRTLRERVAEHRRAVKNFALSSEIANHVLETGHRMDWEGASSLARERGCFRRRFKEAWFSKFYSSSNRTFHDLDPAWDDLF